MQMNSFENGSISVVHLLPLQRRIPPTTTGIIYTCEIKTISFIILRNYTVLFYITVDGFGYCTLVN